MGEGLLIRLLLLRLCAQIGDTPLHNACYMGLVDIMKVLLAAQERTWRPITMWVVGGSGDEGQKCSGVNCMREVRMLLLTPYEQDGDTAMDMARSRGHSEVEQALEDFG